MRKLLKYILGVILFLLLLYGFLNKSLLYYGFRQAEGQFKIIFNTRPVNEVLNDPTVPDSIKQKIMLIDSIKEFARTKLGLNARDNYTSFYNQAGGESMWVLTACEPFRLVAVEWKFPLIGKFSYKGFFDEKMARNEEVLLKQKDIDTSIRTAEGWSTLGFFKDPILSGMLRRDETGLADLIIHELSHGTIFVKNNIELNENLASFIASIGTREYLKSKSRDSSLVFKNYLLRLKDRTLYNEYILRSCNLLDSLYRSFPGNFSIEEKHKAKAKMIAGIVSSLDNVNFSTGYKSIHFFSNQIPNNTYFTSFLTYRGIQNEFESEMNEKCSGNIVLYIQYLKNKYH